MAIKLFNACGASNGQIKVLVEYNDLTNIITSVKTQDSTGKESRIKVRKEATIIIDDVKISPGDNSEAVPVGIYTMVEDEETMELLPPFEIDLNVSNE